VICIFPHSKNTFFSLPVAGIDILTILHPATYDKNCSYFLQQKFVANFAAKIRSFFNLLSYKSTLNKKNTGRQTKI